MTSCIAVEPIGGDGWRATAAGFVDFEGRGSTPGEAIDQLFRTIGRHLLTEMSSNSSAALQEMVGRAQVRIAYLLRKETPQ